MIFAKSTGRIYWVPGKEDMVGPMMRYDPVKGGAPEKIKATLGLRAATCQPGTGRLGPGRVLGGVSRRDHQSGRSSG